MKKILSKQDFNIIITYFCLSFGIACNSGCKKMIEVGAPITYNNAANVYQTDATAAAALTGIYARLSANNMAYNEDLPCLFLYAGLSSDELELKTTTNARYLSYYTNQLTSASPTGFWYSAYPIVYFANSAIEGLINSESLSPQVKQELLGEAKFIRGFCFFYLANLYGDVALSTSTDWQINAAISRSSKEKVWNQIISDLRDAQNLLNSNYVESDAISSKSSTERIRPNKWAATAMLARAYLYTGNWAGADSASSAVINNKFLYDTVALNNVFLKNSKETIWQLQATGTGTRSNTGEGYIFVLPTTGPGTNGYPVYLSNRIVSSFEAGDNRKVSWINSVTPSPGTTTYYYPYKYKIGAITAATSEYCVVLRIAEQYLIRAEAKAQQDKVAEAQSDLNIIRKRAGLQNTAANDKLSLLNEILHERQVELFTEWGHRWLDLKRTAKVDAVMNVVTPQKGGTWNSNWQWYPIPFTEIQKDPNLLQNIGY